MPVPKSVINFYKFLSEELSLPVESIYIKGLQDKHFFLFIWTKKLSKKDINRITSSQSAGGSNTYRSKLAKIVKDLGGIGYYTSVEPNQAPLYEVFSMLPYSGQNNSVCVNCFTRINTEAEICARTCIKCYCSIF